MMPLRARGIGSRVSEEVAKLLRERREELGWSRPQLSAEIAKIAEQGENLSAATINAIENGISENGARRIRRLTADEVSILARAMHIEIILGGK